MEIHIYDELEEYFGLKRKQFKTISVKDIIENTGRHSGLTISVKEIITQFTSNWKNCHIQLRRGTRPGWFIVESIIETNGQRWLVSESIFTKMG